MSGKDQDRFQRSYQFRQSLTFVNHVPDFLKGLVKEKPVKRSEEDPAIDEGDEEPDVSENGSNAGDLKAKAKALKDEELWDKTKGKFLKDLGGKEQPKADKEKGIKEVDGKWVKNKDVQGDDAGGKKRNAADSDEEEEDEDDRLKEQPMYLGDSATLRDKKKKLEYVQNQVDQEDEMPTIVLGDNQEFTEEELQVLNMKGAKVTHASGEAFTKITKGSKKEQKEREKKEKERDRIINNDPPPTEPGKIVFKKPEKSGGDADEKKRKADTDSEKQKKQKSNPKLLSFDLDN